MIVKESVFLSKLDREDSLYRAIRDLECHERYRTILEKMWDGYKQHAPRGFKQNLQISFHSRWWEMYLSLGLLQLGFNIARDKRDNGPDIALNFDSSIIWIEAVAPSKGKTSDRVPTQEPNTVTDMPRREGLLRLTQSISSKKEIFDRYIQESVIQDNAPCIIALSACNLDLGDTLNWPCPAPIALLTGADTFVLSSDGNHYTQRNTIQRDSGSDVDTMAFENEQFQNISAVLYSHHEPLSAPNPSNSLKLFLNPHAKHKVPETVLKQFHEVWSYSSEERNIIWGKI